jgi:hypothetical protein
VRQREEIDGGEPDAPRDPGRRIDAGGDRREDGVPGGVLRVDDPARAVPAFAREIERARGIAVEPDVQFVEEQLFPPPDPRARVGRWPRDSRCRRSLP